MIAAGCKKSIKCISGPEVQMDFTKKEVSLYYSDEPVIEDRLKRELYADAFARLAKNCTPPFVVCLYGGWGTGKTSLMRLIDQKLDKEEIGSVWFDPWEHQFDENPILGLMHTVSDSYSLGSEGKKLLMVMAGALGSMLLNATTKLSLKDITDLGKQVEEERFLVREERIRLRKYFEELTSSAKAKKNHKRIVFFIDDLDRCMPPNIMKMLEALKLYLNLPGCVYFLGVDRLALEIGVKQYYKDLDISEANYLDKIVQLPFTIPPISPDSMEDFIESLLPSELSRTKDLLVKGLGDNPRQIKRFINVLMLNDQLAKGSGIENYDPVILALILIIQHRSYGLFRVIGRQPSLLKKIIARQEETKKLYDEFIERDERLEAVISAQPLLDETNLYQYIYLTKIASIEMKKEGASAEMAQPVTDVNSVFGEHARWLDSNGKYGKQAVLRGYDLSGLVLKGMNLKRADLASSDLSKANLSEVNLEEADLSFCTLAAADLSKSDLTLANLQNSDLTAADFTAVDLTGANMERVLLRKAKFNRSTLEGANLSGAIFTDAIFWETSMKHADLSSANLRGVDLTQVTGLTEKQLNLCDTDKNTILPKTVSLD